MVDTTTGKKGGREIESKSDQGFPQELRDRVLRTLDESVSYDDATLRRMQTLRRQALEGARGTTAADKSKSTAFELIWARRSALALALTLGVATLLVLDGLDGGTLYGGDEALYTDARMDDESLKDPGLLASRSDSSGVSANQAVDVIKDDADLPVEEQIALFADDALELDFYESLAFYEWLESREV